MPCALPNFYCENTWHSVNKNCVSYEKYAGYVLVCPEKYVYILLEPFLTAKLLPMCIGKLDFALKQMKVCIWSYLI